MEVRLSIRRTHLIRRVFLLIDDVVGNRVLDDDSVFVDDHLSSLSRSLVLWVSAVGNVCGQVRDYDFSRKRMGFLDEIVRRTVVIYRFRVICTDLFQDPN